MREPNKQQTQRHHQVVLRLRDSGSGRESQVVGGQIDLIAVTRRQTLNMQHADLAETTPPAAVMKAKLSPILGLTLLHT